MGQPVPYRYITDLPHKAQVEIERDFADVVSQITSPPAMFDAIIDPSITASDPTNHEYINLTELIANESWPPYEMFNVGVKQRGIDISTLGDLSLFGLGPTTPDVNHTGWDWATLNCANTQQVFYYNIIFSPNTGVHF